jgi:hypothetical protein
MPVARVGRELCRAYVRAGRDEKALAICSHPVADRYAADLYDVVFEEAFAAGRFDVASEAGEASAARRHDPMSAYNVACAHARAGRPDDALAWFRTAAERGFDDVELAANDDDLATVRDLAEFRTILADIRAASEGAAGRDTADSQVP